MGMVSGNATASVTRRGFVGGTAAAIGAATIGAGIAPAMADETAAEGGAPAYPCAVYETDVLVVGAGIAGCTAARRAMDMGATVTIIDKGPFGHSGASGINWGHDTQSAEWCEGDGSEVFEAWVRLNNGVVDQTYGMELCKAMKEARPNATFEQCGNILERLSGKSVSTGIGVGNETDQVENGIPAGKNAPGFAVDHGSMVRFLAHSALRMGATVFDRTMALDLLVSEDGRIAGVVALKLETGEAAVFRAKAVVLATGSYAYVAGWNGMRAYSLTGPECTGDGHRMLMSAGLAMRDMEQLPFDAVQWNPKGTRQGMGSMGCSIVNHTRVLDKDLERFTQIIEETPGYGNPEFMRLCVKAILDGRATENNGFFVDTADLDEQNRYYRRSRENQKAMLDYDLPQYVEVVPEQWECAGRPFMAPNGETEIPGLFYAAAGQGAWRGMAFFGAYGSGYIAGRGAAELVPGIDVASPVPWDKVDAAISDAYALLKAEPEDGIRSTDVFREIQQTYWKGIGIMRSEDSINESLAELDRIEAEDLPRMFIASKSMQLNRDWQSALEARSLLMCAKATGYAALQRKETRGAHCRLDYPQMDNDNWLVNTRTQFKDGVWTSEIIPLDDAYLTPEQVKEILPPPLGID